jgi:hypothetical protein
MPSYDGGVGFALDENDVLDDAEWDHYHAYWRDLVDGLLESAGQAGEWPSWEPSCYGDGVTPIERMYRSICDGRSSHLDRAFSIQQARPRDDTASSITAVVKDFAASIQDFPDIPTTEAANEWFAQVPPHERVPRWSLDIILVHSDATAAAVRSLLSVWLQPETTPGTMRSAIEAMSGVEGW